MPTPHDQAPPPTLDPDSLYVSCLDEVQAQQRMRPDLSSLHTGELLWSVTVFLAHALETAARGLGALGPHGPQGRVQWVAKLLWTPTPARLHDLWRAWCRQHTDWGDADTLQVPVYFLFCRTNHFASLRELDRRGSHLPVFKGWAGLEACPWEPDAVRQQRFLRAMDTTLWATVRRRLDRTRDAGHVEDLSAIADPDNVAIEGAVAKKHRAEEWIVKLLRRGGAIPTDSGKSIEIPTIPELPVLGMERAAGLDAVWRANAKEAAIKVLAKIAPGILGVLETALPDAAHAAQRRERGWADAQERGGSGGRKAKKAGRPATTAKHVPLDALDKKLWLDPKAEGLAGKRSNAQQELEAHEEEVKAQEDATRALRIAVDRWGPSGQRMLEALASEPTKKAAAEAAMISAPALTERLKTLKKLLDS